jgi:alpha-galactosidase
MLVAQARWLPQYKDAIKQARKDLKTAKRLGTHSTVGAARLKVRTVAEMKADAERARQKAQAAPAKPATDGKKKARK